MSEPPSLQSEPRTKGDDQGGTQERATDVQGSPEQKGPKGPGKGDRSHLPELVPRKHYSSRLTSHHITTLALVMCWGRSIA